MNIPYRINAIRTSQFALFSDKFENGAPVDIQTEFSFAHNKELNSIRCTCKINYLQKETLLLLLELQCFFGIAPDGVTQLKKEKKVSVDFLRYIGTIVTGTARGVIHTRTEGTILNGFVLPPLNLVEAIKNDMLLDI